MNEPIDWNIETIRYDRPHPRLVRMARELLRLPGCRVLDLGCSTAALRTLLPPNYQYFGCDVTDHARKPLGNERFIQLDLAGSCDLSPFAVQRIELVHIGGLLEYLPQPGKLLSSARRVAPGARLVASIINFESDRFRESASHHKGWVYKPTLEELTAELAAAGWHVERVAPFWGKGRVRDACKAALAAALGLDHRWTRRSARQFILTAA